MRPNSSTVGFLLLVILATGCPRAEPRATQPVPATQPEQTVAPTPAPTATTAPDLHIELAASPLSAGPGQEIELRLTYRNTGNAALRLLESTTFVGEEFVVQPAGGEPIRYEGGYATFSPAKRNRFSGGTFVLEPGAEETRVLPVWIDAQYRLLFTNTPDAELGIGPSEVKTRLGAPPELPSKYVSAGRIFPVGHAGPVTLRFRYQRDEHDRSWIITTRDGETVPLDDLWLGRVESNPVELELR